MTGEKRRGAPLSPGEDRERARAATRAMHEAIQEARAAERALRAAVHNADDWYRRKTGDLRDAFGAHVNERIGEVNKSLAGDAARMDAQLADRLRTVMAAIGEVAGKIDDLEARALGFEGGHDLKSQVADRVVRELRTPRFAQMVADRIAIDVQAASGVTASGVTVRVARPGEKTGIYIEGDRP